MERSHSVAVLLCCLLRLPFRRRSIVNVSRLMRSAALKQCQSSSPWEMWDSARGGRDTGPGNDTLIMYSLEQTWDTAWDTLSQQPHHFLVSAGSAPGPLSSKHQLGLNKQSCHETSFTWRCHKMSQQARYCFEFLRDTAWQPPVTRPGVRGLARQWATDGIRY